MWLCTSKLSSEKQLCFLSPTSTKTMLELSFQSTFLSGLACSSVKRDKRDRMDTISGFDFERPDERFNHWLALKISQCIRGRGSKARPTVPTITECSELKDWTLMRSMGNKIFLTVMFNLELCLGLKRAAEIQNWLTVTPQKIQWGKPRWCFMVNSKYHVSKSYFRIRSEQLSARYTSHFNRTNAREGRFIPRLLGRAPERWFTILILGALARIHSGSSGIDTSRQTVVFRAFSLHE